MKEHDSIVRIFSGSEVTALMIKARLEEAGIVTMIRNDFQSGVAAGFYAGPPADVDLFVSDEDLAAANLIIPEILNMNTE